MALKPYVTQNPAYAPIKRTDKRYVIPYGGSGGGKSVFLAQYLCERCMRDERENILIIRKYQTDVRDSCYAEVRKSLQAINKWQNCKTRRNEMRITFPNGSQILGVGLDKKQRLKSISGPTKVHLEEANEISEESFNELDRRLRGSHKPTFQIFLTFNPLIGDEHWIKRYFFGSDTEKSSEKIFTLQTNYKDNIFNDEEYKSVLEDLPENERKIYLDGEFVELDKPNQLIKTKWVDRAFHLGNTDYGNRSLGIDSARFGKDKITFAATDGNVLVDIDSVKNERTTETSSRAIMYIEDNDIDRSRIVIDTVGIGAGVADNLVEEGIDPLEFVAGGSIVEDDTYESTFFRFNNIRSQAWFWMRKLLKDGKICFDIDKESGVGKRVKEDLTAPKYRTIGEKKLEVEPKEGRGKNWGLRSRINRSTDEGDAVVQAFFCERLKNARRNTSDYSKVF